LIAGCDAVVRIASPGGASGGMAVECWPEAEGGGKPAIVWQDDVARRTSTKDRAGAIIAARPELRLKKDVVPDITNHCSGFPVVA